MGYGGLFTYRIVLTRTTRSADVHTYTHAGRPTYIHTYQHTGIHTYRQRQADWHTHIQTGIHRYTHILKTNICRD